MKIQIKTLFKKIISFHNEFVENEKLIVKKEFIQKSFIDFLDVSFRDNTEKKKKVKEK